MCACACACVCPCACAHVRVHRAPCAVCPCPCACAHVRACARAHVRVRMCVRVPCAPRAHVRVRIWHVACGMCGICACAYVSCAVCSVPCVRVERDTMDAKLFERRFWRSREIFRSTRRRTLRQHFRHLSLRRRQIALSAVPHHRGEVRYGLVRRVDKWVVKNLKLDQRRDEPEDERERCDRVVA
jgi:hypothetical protein